MCIDINISALVYKNSFIAFWLSAIMGHKAH